MIARLYGKLLDKSPTRVVLDVHGVGYEIAIPLSTFEQLGAAGAETTLLTHLHVREEALQLFGFATPREKQLFQLLIAVSGVGPKLAQSILSGSDVTTFCQHIQQSNTAALTAIPGIGKKTAERLVVELRDRVAPLLAESEQPGAIAGTGRVSEEALMALLSLGYPRANAEKGLRQAQLENGELPVEELIKQALRHL